MSLISKDTGIVIYDADRNLYYYGYNTFGKDLRKAKIYHNQNCVNEVYQKYKGWNLKQANVEINLI